MARLPPLLVHSFFPSRCDMGMPLNQQTAFEVLLDALEATDMPL